MSRRRGLRFRIVFAVVLITAACLVLVGATTIFALRDYLYGRLDRQLTASMDRLADEVGSSGEKPVPTRMAMGQSAGTLVAAINDGTVVAAFPAGDRNSAVSDADLRAIAALEPTSGELELPSHGSFRVRVAQQPSGVVLVVGQPTKPIADLLGELAIIESITFTFAVAAVGVLSAAWVRRSLRPLSLVTAKAREVSEMPLSTGDVALPSRVLEYAHQSEAAEVARAFNQMLEHVESALRARHRSGDRLRNFLANASHELRTPVAVIRSHADFAQQAAHDLPEDISTALDRIGAESERMSNMVEDLLLLARLDAGRALEMERIDIVRIALDAVTDARAAGPGHTWRLELPPREISVFGDRHALHQVMSNLLGNARDHTPDGCVVSTAIVLDPQEPGWVRVRVSDDGPGVGADVLPRVFERFVRSADSRAHRRGSGLGLSIVAAIVAAHGGDVGVENATPHGTVVTLRLPLMADV